MVDNQDEEELIKGQQFQTETNLESEKDDKNISDDPVNEQAIELENKELDNLTSQQRTKEQNNEDLGQLENETETNMAIEQARNQVTENGEQSQVSNKIMFSRRSVPKVKTYLQYQKPDSSEWTKIQVISGTGKVTLSTIQYAVSTWERTFINGSMLKMMKKSLYSMFHVTWTTFKFNRNQLGTVSVYFM